MSYVKGERLVAYGDEPLLSWVFIQVRRCAKDGSWVDIACCTWAVYWTKRIPTRVLAKIAKPYDWTAADIAAQAARYDEVHTFDLPASQLG